MSMSLVSHSSSLKSP